ncbi:MAG TPA: excinuclease ABC subunit UvrA [Flammeovirgaceae bacterium]|nr:excinuclease ABC subunit UvrA [Flammeovirgaceae bacterium]
MGTAKQQQLLTGVASEQEQVEVYGAREHNLKNIDVVFPRQKLVVLTGISGSGKSSLAFDTIYAEGQRRYMESFSAYVRTFIGNMERPDVDKILGLSPVIAIEQKTTSRNPRSTVGTVTEVYDFLRLLYARAGVAVSYLSGKPMIRQTEEQIQTHILQQYEGQKITLLAPLVKGRKGHYRELFVQLRKSGYLRVRVDGELMEIAPKMQLDRYKTHDVELVVDRLLVRPEDAYRLGQSIATAMRQGNGLLQVLDAAGKTRYFSKNLMDPDTGLAYDEPAPNTFSFNSPYGACPQCNGLGVVDDITRDTIIPDPSLSVSRGGIAPLGQYRDIWIFKKIEAILKRQGYNITTPINKIDEATIDLLLYGESDPVAVASKKYPGTDWHVRFEGIISFMKKQQDNGTATIRKWLKDFTITKPCPECAGARLRKEALHFFIADKNIAQLAQMSISDLQQWFVDIEARLDERQNLIAAEILKEIRKRLRFLNDVGIGYLTLDRPLRSLSGGEAQRIRLATQIGTQLVGVMYILDEPSIGLHQRDNRKLLAALQQLRDLGNTVLVVEHDKETMLEADYIIDIGPGAGRHGGRIVAAGPPAGFVAGNSLTAAYLRGEEAIAVPAQRRKGKGQHISLRGASGNNLQNVDVDFPLGTMICVTGVSGSGKSTLIHDTLYPVMSQRLYRSHRQPLPYQSVEGLEYIDKVIEIDQAPIGRTPRSNPATYIGVFADIRSLFTGLPEAKIRGYKPGRFSFNVKGGRCEDCEGAGMKLIEMDFLPDVHVHCETCKGKRYNRETLEIRYRGKSIADVLDMTVDEAVDFFASHPKILRKVKTLQDVGLGYITLGQHATTLSGGEAQRVKLASELSKKDTGKTFYILDEPTTGLHFQDIRHLLNVLNKLVDKGNTVLIIEHNLDVIKTADYLIDLGPEGGAAGGRVVATGTPEQVAKVAASHTGRFLREELDG